jgi:hypothetical protein
MNSLAIYSITHKKFNFPTCDWINQIAVGDYSREYNGLTDNNGINIAKKNSSYNEITAQYWVRYNAPTAFVGFVHYRRYFIFGAGFHGSTPEYFSQESDAFSTIATQSQKELCNEILNFSDLIVPRATYFPHGLKNHYLENQVPAETWEAFSHFASVLFPESKKYIKSLEISNFGHMRNMYIMPWNLFCSYIDLLIPILNAVYNEIGGAIYRESFKNRYPGFLSEHFLNLWLSTIPRRKFEVPIVNLI